MILDDFKNQTYFNKCLTTILYIINKSNEFRRITGFYLIQSYITVKVTNNHNLASRTRSRRICLGVRFKMTLIIKHIVTYA